MRMLEKVTIFLGAFLLFLVQPMTGNTLLPLFGGTASVWSISLATFQTLLVGGYFYAHIASNACKGTSRSRILLLFHCLFLFASSLWLFLFPSFRTCLSSLAADFPLSLGAFLSILLIVAVPFIVLSANSSLVQRLSGGRYGLYAVSNLGSLLGLWAYPFFFECRLALTEQWTTFAALTLIYAILFLVLSVASQSPVESMSSEEAASSARPTYGRYFLISGVSCFLLNAVSTHLCSDITPLPLMWVVLLSAYLLSYVLGFTERGSKLSPFAALFLIPLVLTAVWHMGLVEYRHYRAELLIGLAVLFLGGLFLHATLYTIRPASRHLTGYYLAIAVGGAVGGSICSFVLPFLSNRIVEYPLALGCILLACLTRAPKALAPILAKLQLRRPAWLTERRYRQIAQLFSLAVCCYGMTRIGAVDGVAIRRYRNFYGTGSVARRVIEVSDGQPYVANEFRCNGTTHGLQVVDGTWKCQIPTVYYAAHAGGLPLTQHPNAISKKPMRVALCGMGIGTLAAFARPGDFYRFYEINPAVAEVAGNEDLFSFVKKSSGSIDIVLDDARRALERERAAGEDKYDVIVVDVFNGDAIPPHMATEEAFELYLDRLAPDGILSFHLSNWHLDLLPLVKAAAKKFNLAIEAYYCAPTRYSFDATWAFMSPAKLPEMYNPLCHQKVDFDLVRDVEAMTDDRHSLVPYIQWRLDSEVE